jgi:endonuclease III
MADLRQALAALRRHYGEPALPPARGAFELVIWENCCYLLSDARRAEVFAGLQQVGLEPRRILDADREMLLGLARRGGMRPETRLFRWLEIARIALDRYGGDLDAALQPLPYAAAKKALQQFPNIGPPAAEKILLYCGVGGGLPLDWNGCRVLLRLGFGRSQPKNYGAQYKSIQAAVEGQLPEGAAARAQAHLLLRQHGKTLCRDKGPDCGECPVVEMCGYGADRQARPAKA